MKAAEYEAQLDELVHDARRLERDHGKDSAPHRAAVAAYTEFEDTAEIEAS